MRFQWLVLDFVRFRQESKEEGRILYYQLPPLSCPHWSFIFPDLVPSFFKVPEGLKHTYYPSPELSSELPQRARVITGKIKAGQVFEPTSGRNASERECSRGRRSLFLSWLFEIQIEMPQLDKLTYFSQFFWLCLLLFVGRWVHIG